MQLDIIRFIQSFHNPFLDILFQAITMIGEEIFLAIIFTAIYWTFNKQLGEFFGFSIFSSICINGAIKNIVRAPRPIGEAGIRTIREHTATGYSFPSGHSQISSSFFSSAAIFLKHRWLYVISIILTCLVGLSRLYLGVHYPIDVVCGILLGLLISLVLYKIFISAKNIIPIYLGFGVVFIGLLLIFPSNDFLKSVALFVGFIIGVYIEKKFVNFSIDGSFKKRFIRWFFGILSIGAIYSLKFILPHDIDIITFIRYMLLSLWGIGIYPYIFTKLKF